MDKVIGFQIKLGKDKVDKVRNEFGGIGNRNKVCFDAMGWGWEYCYVFVSK